jgi:hypothetical protein
MTEFPRYGRIENTGKKYPRLEPSEIATALGAEPIDIKVGDSSSPLSLMQLQQELLQRLQSSGGRPALTDTSSRKKIPLSDRQWTKLEEIAAAAAAPGFSPSAGQVASILLAHALQSLPGAGLENMTPNANQ